MAHKNKFQLYVFVSDRKLMHFQQTSLTVKEVLHCFRLDLLLLLLLVVVVLLLCLCVCVF